MQKVEERPRGVSEGGATERDFGRQRGPAERERMKREREEGDTSEEERAERERAVVKRSGEPRSRDAVSGERLRDGRRFLRTE